jgi:hypothetical protein
MHTDAQSNADTQHRTTETKRDEQDDVVHRPRDDLMGLDHDWLFCDVNSRASSMLPMRRPTHSWKQRQQPPRVTCEVRRGEDDDQGHNGEDDLKGDGVHVHWEV